MSKAGRNQSSKVVPDPDATPEDFEAAMTELESVVALLEAGDLRLEDSLRAYKRGMLLASYCRKTLGEAEQQVKILEEGVFKDFRQGDDSEDDSKH